MEITKTKYVIRNKTTKEYMARESEMYCEGELCPSVEHAEFWDNKENIINDVNDYIENCLDDPCDYEPVKVTVKYIMDNLQTKSFFGRL